MHPDGGSSHVRRLDKRGRILRRLKDNQVVPLQGKDRRPHRQDNRQSAEHGNVPRAYVLTAGPRRWSQSGSGTKGKWALTARAGALRSSLPARSSWRPVSIAQAIWAALSDWATPRPRQSWRTAIIAWLAIPAERLIHSSCAYPTTSSPAMAAKVASGM